MTENHEAEIAMWVCKFAGGFTKPSFTIYFYLIKYMTHKNNLNLYFKILGLQLRKGCEGQ